MQWTNAVSGRHDTNRTSSQLAIDARDVHVTYPDGTQAVCGVDIAVGRGEFFGFLGPNGAGKTTTIKTLVGLLHPSQGSVSINGYDVEDDPQAVGKSIGYMAQETSIDEELTARENVRFACRVYGVPEAERQDRIEELLDLVGLAEVADQRAETFSGGMKKRLDAATVLVPRPPVVFLDEPTTGLDPEARMRLWDHFESIQQQGTTVFLTTQYLEEVDRLCDRVGLLKDGQVVTTDTPSALKSAVGGEVLDLTLADASDRTRDRAIRAIRQSSTLDAASIDYTDNGLSITAEQVREAVMSVFVALHDAGVTVTSFDVRSPTLDDVFLALTDGDTEGMSEPTDGTQHSTTRSPEVSR